MQLKKFIIVCGHYGCGKTNLSLNLAIDAAARGETVKLVDLDLVNPYFRSSEYQALLEKKKIHLIAPVYANTNLDVPSISAEVFSVFDEKDETIILDVGGDDVGATVLGRISKEILKIDYEMLYVINHYRIFSEHAQEAKNLLREIEGVSRLQATGLVNNSHLKQETTADTIIQTAAYAKETSALLNLPLRFTTAPEHLAAEVSEKVENVYPIKIYVRSPWESFHETIEF